MDSAVSVQHIYKNFGKFEAVKDISFEVGKGEVLGLLGPNGAGKTTTIQMLLGVMSPTAGQINYFGKDLWQHRSEILEKVNFSSTYVNLPWDLKVHEVLSYLSYLYQINDRKTTIKRIIETFRLEPLLKKSVNDLSAGQETRLNLAKAFINNPKILLLDEPTASLDPEIADYIRKFLLEQREREDLSVLITSHNMAEVEEVCDRVIFINHGQIVADDTPSNLAKTLENTTLELLFVDKNIRKAAIKLLSKSYDLQQKREWVQIKLKEMQIPEVLSQLVKADLSYQEININKPNLEDYFIQIAKGQSRED